MGWSWTFQPESTTDSAHPMAPSEKQPLFAETGPRTIQKPDQTATAGVGWRHSLLVLCMFLYYLGTTTFKHVHEQWVEETIRKEKFDNETLQNNYTSCGLNPPSDQEYQNYKELHRLKSNWLMYYKFAVYFPALIMTLVLPSYSDMYGRCYLIILNTFVACVRLCVESIIIFSEQRLFWVLIVSGLEGLTGSVYTFSAICYAYIADITDKEKRTFGIISLEFLILISSVFSNKLSGLVVDNLGLDIKHTAIVCTGIVVFSFIVAVLVPETTKPDQANTATLSPVAAAKQTRSFYCSNGTRGQRHQYIVLLLAFLFTEISYYHRQLLEKIYFEDAPFCWSSSKVSYYSMTRKAGQGLTGYILLRPMSRFMSDIAITIVSFLSNMGSYFLEAFATSSLALYFVPAIAVLSFITVPIIRSMMSKFTPPNRQASMFAGLAVVEIIASLISISDNTVYDATQSIMKGFAFVIMGLCVFTALILVCIYSCIQPLPYKHRFKEAEQGNPQEDASQV